MTFKKVDPKQSFPKMEEEVLKFWQENNIFKKSIENREGSEEFNFYDGPPFATGTPHYGHILAGALKDVIPRFQTMKGKKVERRFGWDTHGLPIENIVEKKLEIKGKEDLEGRIGVFDFNETCRKNVFGYVDEWRKTVDRMGRWVDMENDYKTMDTSFMESVWWVFKTIYDKGLVYQGHRVVPYSVGMSTPLSNFEVNQGYMDKQDKTITVKFKVKGSEKKYILAWTTTPWTLPANLGLAVGEDIEYVELMDKSSKEIYILAKARINDYYKNEEEYEILRVYDGKCLIGIEYEPLFNDFLVQNGSSNLPKEIFLGKNAYKVISGHHVTTESGTGIVHIAPAYGEDDYHIGKTQDLGFVSHISDSGKTENLLEDNGIWVFDFNEIVIEKLKKSGEVVKISTITHSYPHCWRSGVPLIYKAISAWYVDVTAIKDQMIKNNQKINWVPDDIKNGRMGKWLEGAKDWNISRNRYWGSAIPVWQNEDKTEEICIGSIKELYELNKDFGQIEFKDGKYFYTNTGKEIDLHKHFVDEILIKNPKTGNTLKRIPEVLDCWFESGSMPYASKHYMGQELEKNSDCLVSKDGTFKFPADFIAEGLDQTRGWFYTLLILGTALFDETPFKNCIVNGIVLAEDGKKMSKSLQNYPAPELIFDKYGADAMRFYLLNSPVVEAQDFRFSEAGVEEVVKKVILPLWNTYYFFTTYANIDNFEPKGLTKTENILDKWLLSELNELTLEVTNAFEKYKLNEATRPIVKFMDNLTNWYIRRSRKRFWKSENDGDKLQAYETLYFALVELTKILAPFMPFVSENIFKNLTGEESVHLEDFPIYNKNLIDLELNETTDKVQKIINLGLAWRANQKIRVRQPLQSITITQSFEKYYNEIIKEELNVKEVLVVDGSSLAKRICKPNGRNIGPKFGKDVKFIMSEAKAGNFTELPNGNVKVGDFELEIGDFELVYESSDANAKIESGFGMVITMDDKITEELKQEGFARDIVRHIQEARKECNYNVDDRIFIKIESNELAETIANFANYIETETLSKIDNSINSPDLEKDISIEEIKIKLSLKK
ncbi:isoleucine--tRNA ligase [Candidatus Gracilibacteria bacterium GN02-872]|nr:isoleucine--tRNA ligase [Candidatus Gracilibacteria bacterium GN02-872]